jgi:RimJ/RimL family protein N-acetyltransferase
MKPFSKILLRKAKFSDVEFLWYLRNRPDVYKYFRHNRPVSWQKHVNWLMPVILGLSPKDIFVIQENFLPIGQIRFDYDGGKKAKIGIAIIKEFRGKGVAIEAIKKELKLLKESKKVKIIIAEVHKNNISSQKLFEKLNFKLKNPEVIALRPYGARKKGKWCKYILKL